MEAMTAPAPAPATFTVLSDRALIRLTGPDWRSFLQGLITQDVQSLSQGDTRYAALLTPQGRILYDLFVTAEADGAMLDAPAAFREALVARLRMYRLRAAVQIEPAAGEVVALFGGVSEVVQGWRPDPRLPALGWRGVDVRAPSGVEEVDGEAYDLHRLSIGAPDLIRDGLSDKVYALEANLDLLNAIDFRKGCFVGQETTSRMKRRSVVKSRLFPLRFDGPAPPAGTEVMNGDLRAGEVRSGGEGRALALLRLDRTVDAVLTAGGRCVSLDAPSWLAPAVREAIAVPSA